MRRLQQGHISAFTTLYWRYRVPVMRFIYGRVRDGFLTEDLCQELFMRLLRSADSFDANRPFASRFHPGVHGSHAVMVPPLVLIDRNRRSAG